MTISTGIKRNIVQVLERILIGDHHNATIRYNLARSLGIGNYRECSKYLRGVYSSWPDYSGLINYPVKDPSGVLSPWDVYQASIRSKSLYLGQYGESRLSLVKFMISKIKKDIIDSGETPWETGTFVSHGSCVYISNGVGGFCIEDVPQSESLAKLLAKSQDMYSILKKLTKTGSVDLDEIQEIIKYIEE